MGALLQALGLETSSRSAVADSNSITAKEATLEHGSAQGRAGVEGNRR